jgi:energy-coupling factor transport system substrate-specific component
MWSFQRGEKMRDLISMWKNTRMSVLVAVSAAVYAAAVLPFKVATIIPGFTEIRPGVAFIVLCSFLFGPAAAWGAAFGNLIGDFFGSLGLGSIFGFAGNFLFGLLPYKIYRALTSAPPALQSFRQWAAVLIAIVLSALVCGFTIGWGVDLLGLVPFHLLGSVIALNNTVLSCILVPILLKVIYSRAQNWGFLYPDIMPEDALKPGKLSIPGILLIVIGAAGGLAFGILAGFHIITLPVNLQTLKIDYIDGVLVFPSPFVQSGYLSGAMGLIVLGTILL